MSNLEFRCIICIGIFFFTVMAKKHLKQIICATVLLLLIHINDFCSNAQIPTCM